MHHRARIASVLFALTLSACNAGGSAVAPIGRPATSPGPGATPTATPAPTATLTASAAASTGTAIVTLTFPVAAASSTARTARKRAYVSAKTQSVQLVVASVNGIAPTTVIATTATVGTGATGCTNGAGGLTCAFTIAAPIGNDVFSIRTYALSGALGNPISIGSATATITAGGSIAIAPELLPVVNSFTVTATPATLPLGVAGKTTLAIAGLDAAGDVIGGIEPYYLPITVSTKDMSGHVTATPALPARITGPGQTITLAYDGIGTGSTFIFDIAVAGDAIAQDVLPQTTTFAFTGGGQHLYVTEQGANAVLVYDIASDGSLSGPSRTLKGAATELDRPISIAVDALGTMYVVNTAKNVVIYSPGSSGNVAPVATFADGADPQFVAIDGTTRFAVGFYPPNASGTPDPTMGKVASLTDYSTPVTPGAPVNFHPDVVIDLPNVGSFTSKNSEVCAGYQMSGIVCFANPIVGTNDPQGNVIPTRQFEIGGGSNAVAIRPDGKLAIANGPAYGQPPSVTTFDFNSFVYDGSLQYPAPTLSIGGAAAGFMAPTALAFDTLGNMYVDDYGQASFNGTVKQYPLNATGNVAPTRTISGLDLNFGIAVGP